MFCAAMLDKIKSVHSVIELWCFKLAFICIFNTIYTEYQIQQ